MGSHAYACSIFLASSLLRGLDADISLLQITYAFAPFHGGLSCTATDRVSSSTCDRATGGARPRRLLPGARTYLDASHMLLCMHACFILASDLCGGADEHAIRT